MKNILVLGNGFDLEHKIPSKYKDFLDFTHFINVLNGFMKKKDDISNQHKNKIYNDINRLSSYYIDINDDNSNERKKYIEELYQLTKDNIWIKYFDKSLKRNKQIGEDFNWVDIEKEISNVIKIFSIDISLNNEVLKKKETMKTIKKNFNFAIEDIVIDIENKFKRDEKNIIPRVDAWLRYKEILRSDFEKCIRALELYLDYFIDYKKINPKINFDDIIFDRIINFNYTDTLRSCYKCMCDIKVEFIHGNANYKRDANENNMVLGIEEFLPDKTRNHNVDLVEYRKFYQRIVKKCDFDYRRYISKNDDEISTFFFGHSMAESDKDILRYLLPDVNNNSRIKHSFILYYSLNDFKSKVMNLIQVLGQDELNQLVCGENPCIEFYDQKDFSDLIKKHNLSLLVKSVREEA